MTTQLSLSPRSWAELGLLSLIWGGSFLSMRLALDEMGPLTVVAWRVSIAALVLWGVVGIARAPVPRGWRIWGAFLVMGLLNNVVPFSLLAWGQQHIETGLAAIINAATAIWGVLFAALFFADERLGARRAAGVALGFGGVVTAIGAGTLAQLDLRSLAQLSVLGATVSYGLAGVWARARLRGLDPRVAAAGMLTGSTLVALPVAIAAEGAPRLDLGGGTWMALGYLSIVATGTAYLLYYRVLGRAGAGNALLATLMVAPVAIVIGAVARGEALPSHAYLGLGLLGLGLALLDGRLPRAARRRFALARAGASR